MAWKNTRHVFHTTGELPSVGSSSRPANGCTTNTSAALVISVSE